MDHVALDWARPDDCYFNHHIVKTFRFHPRQRGHLRTTLDLKNADRVGRLHDLESGGIVFWNVSKVERSSAFATKFERILHDRHHAEPEKIDFDDAKIFAIVLVPLRDDAARHRGIFQWHKRAEFILANDHPTGMLSKMARQSVDRLI